MQLVSETIQNKPTNELFNIVMGVLFIAVGVWFAIGALREILKEQKAERESEQQAEAYEAVETKEKSLRDHLVQTEEKAAETKKETEAEEEKDKNNIEETGTEHIAGTTETEVNEIKENGEETEQPEELETDYEEK